MAHALVVHRSEDLRLLRERLAAPDRALKQIGALLVSQAQRAFVEQRLGEMEWPERYPEDEEPFVNVAGLISDFNRGVSAPPSRRFERRPAGTDTGALAGSISFAVRGGQVAAGSNLPYASHHQWGGLSSQPVTDGAKRLLEAWLDTPEGAPFREKLTPFLDANELNTEVVQRPFLGITDEIEGDIREVVEAWAAEERT